MAYDEDFLHGAKVVQESVSDPTDRAVVARFLLPDDAAFFAKKMNRKHGEFHVKFVVEEID